ncbi:hypothetical protein DM01DRAFT_1380569 [Hesseltinella vesiculosa]|uniref:Uncharacterized protein n=1 Tax=Hesseltinella vesiculosa TaxID=101127 RepID=A0A1X2GVY6_9FUNG|nr:hypothetical protein DM01DRAFT_1380569 [Hesseltinella vesiculosa]
MCKLQKTWQFKDVDQELIQIIFTAKVDHKKNRMIVRFRSLSDKIKKVSADTRVETYWATKQKTSTLITAAEQADIASSGFHALLTAYTGSHFIEGGQQIGKIAIVCDLDNVCGNESRYRVSLPSNLENTRRHRRVSAPSNLEKIRRQHRAGRRG